MSISYIVIDQNPFTGGVSPFAKVSLYLFAPKAAPPPSNPYTDVDGGGEPLSGANKYKLTFAKGETPPVKGFWSITMYEIDKGWWFVPNPLNKFTVSLRDNPKYNPDGSLTLYLQNVLPGKDMEANWLPAPRGNFIAMLRMYWPKSGDL